MRNEQFVRKRELKDCWDDEVYTVCNQVDMDVPMYDIKNQQGRRQTLHGNQLFIIEKVDPEANPQVAVRLFDVASEISSRAQHHEMFEASTPPKETQAHVASPLSVKAQNALELKPQELITCACKALRCHGVSSDVCMSVWGNLKFWVLAVKCLFPS